MDRSQWARPFFVSPHAVDQFRARIADRVPADVIAEVQQMLQDKWLPPAWVPAASRPITANVLPVDAELRTGGLTLIYLGWLGSNPVYVPVMAADGSHGDWPVVPTVWGRESRLHRKLVATAAHKEQTGRFLAHRWTEEDDALLAALRQAGLSIKRAAKVMRRGHDAAWRRIHHPPNRRRDWSTEAMEIAVALRVAGKSCRETGMVVGRTPGGVAMRLYRYRRAHPRDKRAWTTVPGPWPATDVALAREMRTAGKTLTEIGAAVHRSPASVSERLRRERQTSQKPRVSGPWTEAELELAHALRARGKSYAYIDRKLGRSAGATHRKLALVRSARLADPRGQALASLVGRIVRQVRQEGLACLPEPFSLRRNNGLSTASGHFTQNGQ